MLIIAHSSVLAPFKYLEKNFQVFSLREAPSDGATCPENLWLSTYLCDLVSCVADLRDVRTNNIGLREDRDYYGQHVDIGFIGDSYTFGWGVEAGERYSSAISAPSSKPTSKPWASTCKRRYARTWPSPGLDGSCTCCNGYANALKPLSASWSSASDSRTCGHAILGT